MKVKTILIYSVSLTLTESIVIVHKNRNTGDGIMDYDVVIVGAGPGGVSAAYFLKKGGAKVLIIEKQKLPRYKTCAGGVPFSALKCFPFSFQDVVEDNITKATFCYREQKVTHPISKKSLTMVMRDKFDYYILKKSDVEVVDSTFVEKVLIYKTHVLIKLKGGGYIKSRYVIGADGAGSVVRKSMGIHVKQPMGLALETELEVEDRILNEYRSRFLVSFGVLDRGYFWIFPKKNHLSVGIGNMEKGMRMRKKLFNTIEEMGLNTQDKIEIFGHPLPIFWENLPLGGNRTFLVGDAANLVDPLTGEGIRHAIVSGKIAAECILDSKEHLYPLKIKREIGKELMWAKKLSCFFYRHQKLCFNLFVKNRFIVKDLMKIINNHSSYKKTLLCVPIYLGLQYILKNQ